MQLADAQSASLATKISCTHCLHALRAKKIWEKLGVQSVIEEATSLHRAGVVALEHIISTKGAWNPLDGVGLPHIV
jgi:hypothetical protein